MSWYSTAHYTKTIVSIQDAISITRFTWLVTINSERRQRQVLCTKLLCSYVVNIGIRDFSFSTKDGSATVVQLNVVVFSTTKIHPKYCHRNWGTTVLKADACADDAKCHLYRRRTIRRWKRKVPNIPLSRCVHVPVSITVMNANIHCANMVPDY